MKYNRCANSGRPSYNLEENIVVAEDNTVWINDSTIYSISSYSSSSSTSSSGIGIIIKVPADQSEQI